MTNDNSKRIREYFTKKYSCDLEFIGLIKSLAYASLFVKNIHNPLTILCVAPAGEGKSQSSNELYNIFSGIMKKKDTFDYDNKIIKIGSDLTLHNLNKLSNSGKNIDGKLLLINDFTLMTSGKANHIIERFIKGISELLSDGFYKYGDFANTFTIIARCNIIFNLTDESFNRQFVNLIRDTFADRCLIIFYKMTDKNTNEMLYKRNSGTSLIQFGDKIKLKSMIINYEKYRSKIVDYTKKYAIITNSSKTRLYEKLLALACSHALLNDRDSLDDSDMDLLEELEKYLYTNNPFLPDFYLRGFAFIRLKKGESIYQIATEYCKYIDENFDDIDITFNAIYKRITRTLQKSGYRFAEKLGDNEKNIKDLEANVMAEKKKKKQEKELDEELEEEDSIEDEFN